MPVKIPERKESKYNGQYSRSLDHVRVLEIFTDSFRIALTSKNPATANDRYSLAIEAYHQFISMNAPSDVKKNVAFQMEDLVRNFREQVVLNEVLGLRERAEKLKTPAKKLVLLNQAKEVIDNFLRSSPRSSSISTSEAALVGEISQAQKLTSLK